MVNQNLNLLPDTGGINLPPLKDIAGNILEDRCKRVRFQTK
jgi:hypothetical protein